MSKKCIIVALYLISLFCIIYYTIKYYYNKNLTFGHNQILIWTMVIVLVIICLIIGIINSIKLNKLQNQNEELLSQISHLSKRIVGYHYSEMSNINSTMECILDLDKGENTNE